MGEGAREMVLDGEGGLGCRNSSGDLPHVEGRNRKLTTANLLAT